LRMAPLLGWQLHGHRKAFHNANIPTDMSFDLQETGAFAWFPGYLGRGTGHTDP
jgi:hypothetical protein